jgi:dTDP-4-dehydrorhamnose reductase
MTRCRGSPTLKLPSGFPQNEVHMRNILQFGTVGQLGCELIRRAERQGIALQAVTLEEADFTRPAEVLRAVERASNIDVVVNAAAFTAVDRAENDEALAMTINADTVDVLARACAARGVPLIHISTDYVFDGQKPSPYVETDTPNPLNAYGRTKLAGENAIRSSGAQHVIIRTSWVYSAFGANFVKTMLRLRGDCDELRIVDDQHGAPTSAADLAGAILAIAEKIAVAPGDAHFGTFNYTGAGSTTWRGFAEAIFERASGWAKMRAHVIPIASAQYPTPARRPRNSRLDCTKIERVYGIRPVPWKNALDRVLSELESLNGKTVS